jgi:hypothetical protein
MAHLKGFIMNIGFDLDNTLVRLNTIEIVSAEMGYDFTMMDSTDWSLACFPKEYSDRLLELWHDPDHMCSLAPYTDSLEKLQQLKQQGHNLFLITARTPPVRERTKEEYVPSLFPNIFTDIRFVDHNTSKQSVLNELEIDVWVDDAPLECQASYYNGRKVYMISNRDTHYNWYLHGWNKINIINSIKDLPW